MFVNFLVWVLLFCKKEKNNFALKMHFYYFDYVYVTAWGLCKC